MNKTNDLEYKKNCDFIIDGINKNITNGGKFYYFYIKDDEYTTIDFANENRIGIIEDFKGYKEFFFFLKGIAKFFNLYYDNTIDFDKIKTIE